MALLKQVNTVESNQETEGRLLGKVLARENVRKEMYWHLGGSLTLGRWWLPFSTLPPRPMP